LIGRIIQSFVIGIAGQKLSTRHTADSSETVLSLSLLAGIAMSWQASHPVQAD
jgi:hypothetical protein